MASEIAYRLRTPALPSVPFHATYAGRETLSIAVLPCQRRLRRECDRLEPDNSRSMEPNNVLGTSSVLG